MALKPGYGNQCPVSGTIPDLFAVNTIIISSSGKINPKKITISQQGRLTSSFI